MKINSAEFLKSAVKTDQFPPQDLPEIAFAGRSNVGKSSLLNLITGKKGLAKVSSNPGKTRTINFFDINGEFRIVDLPGYGYARVSKEESQSWGKMMENYLEKRPNLCAVVQLVDIRHDPTAQDVQMYEYLRYYGLSGLIAATKSDKVSKNEAVKNMARIRKVLDAGDDIIVPVSALGKTGIDEMLSAMDALLIRRRTQ